MEVCFSLLQNFSATLKIYMRNWQITWEKTAPKQTALKSYEILLLSDIKIFSCLAKSEIIIDFLISFSHFSWCSVNSTEVLLLWQLTIKQAVNAFHLNHPAVSHGATVARLWPPQSLTGHSSLYSRAFPQVLEKMNFWTGKCTLARNISYGCGAMADTTHSLTQKQLHSANLFVIWTQEENVLKTSTRF